MWFEPRRFCQLPIADYHAASIAQALERVHDAHPQLRLEIVMLTQSIEVFDITTAKRLVFAQREPGRIGKSTSEWVCTFEGAMMGGFPVRDEWRRWVTLEEAEERQRYRKQREEKYKYTRGLWGVRWEWVAHAWVAREPGSVECWDDGLCCMPEEPFLGFWRRR